MAGMEPAHPVDLETWPRREHFLHYRDVAPSSYTTTVEVDVTAFADAMRRSPRKTYLAQIWAAATAVNAHDEFRMCLTDDRAPAVWPTAHPSFTLLNTEQNTFASVWAPYHPDFGVFHDDAAAVLAEHARATSLYPMGPPPAGTFEVSSMPWTSFTGFCVEDWGGSDRLMPAFTLGRYRERDGRTLMPLAVRVHHMAADGFHVARLLDELQGMLADPTWVG